MPRHRIAISAAFLLLAGCGGPPITKGDLVDWEVADEVRECAHMYFRLKDRSAPTALWKMCLEATNSSADRDVTKLKKHIIDKEGWDVFTFDARP